MPRTNRHHIYLLTMDGEDSLTIPRSMQLVAGRTAQEYNQRKPLKVTEENGALVLREPPIPYRPNFDPQIEPLSTDNRHQLDLTY